VWGELKAVHEVKEIFGFVPSRIHANWTIEIGSMIIMGCQVLYVSLCPTRPEENEVKDWKIADDGKLIEYKRPSTIHFSE
jgi:hypothetical protein